MNASQLLVVLLTAACSAEVLEPADAHDVGVADPASPAAFDAEAAAELAATWRPETIQLPDAFAPGLPAGTEELLFSPGMYEAESPQHWSYVFVIAFDERLAGREDLLDVLEQYYVGLIRAVAGSRGHTLEKDATVALEELAPGRYRATVELIDAFVTLQPLTIRMDLTLEDRDTGSLLSAAASKQDRDHAVWAELLAVREHLRRGF